MANAVYDGTDAVMLSGESAVGKYPVETVSMMGRIVFEAERHIKERAFSEPHIRGTHLSIAETICEATAHAADDLDLRGIAVFTESGSTARQLSKYHPSVPIFALSPSDVTINRLNLLWGTVPDPLPQGQYDRGAGRCGGKPPRTGRLCAAARSHRHRGREPHQVRLNQLPSPACDGRAQSRRRAFLRSPRR